MGYPSVTHQNHRGAASQILSDLDSTVHAGSESDEIWQVWQSIVSRYRSPHHFGGLHWDTPKYHQKHAFSLKITKNHQNDQKTRFQNLLRILVFPGAWPSSPPHFSAILIHFSRTLNNMGPKKLREGLMAPHLSNAARRGGGPVVTIAPGGPVPTATMGAVGTLVQSL